MIETTGNYIIAVIACLGGFCLAVFFLVYGVKAGILEKRILAHHPDIYATGKSAVRRGIFYVFISIFFFAGAIITLLSLIAKLSK